MGHEITTKGDFFVIKHHDARLGWRELSGSYSSLLDMAQKGYFKGAVCELSAVEDLYVTDSMAEEFFGAMLYLFEKYPAFRFAVVTENEHVAGKLRPCHEMLRAHGPCDIDIFPDVVSALETLNG